MDLTFEELREANRTRCGGAFHEIDEWSPTDWACAAAGELGEACNLIKKLRRLTGPTKESGKANTPSENELISGIAMELADTVIYIDLLAQRLGITLELAIVSKFNQVSARVGSDIRIGMGQNGIRCHLCGVPLRDGNHFICDHCGGSTCQECIHSGGECNFCHELNKE